MKYFLLALLVISSVSALANTSSSQPNITATFNEQVTIPNAQLVRQGGALYDLFINSSTGVPLSASTFANPVIFKAQRGLQNDQYTLTYNASDVMGNAWRTPLTYKFEVKSPGQLVTLILPSEFGGTNDTGADFMIESEYSSQCRWKVSNNPITRTSDFLLMNRFQSPEAGSAIYHKVDDIFANLSITPVQGTTVNITVTCDDALRLSSRVFTVVYTTVPAVVTVTNTPNPVIDPDDTNTTIKINASQEVWCTFNNEELFGLRDTDNFKSTLTAKYDEPPQRSYNARTYQVNCINRAGLETTTLHTILFDYQQEVVVNVTSPAFTNSRNYVLTVNTSKRAQCTAVRGSTAVTLFPGVGTYATDFYTQSMQLSEGNTTFTVTCEGYQPPPKIVSHTVLVDSVKPTLTLLAPAYSCDLRSVTFSFNASDTTSGIESYNYSIKTKNGTRVVDTTTVNSADVTVRNVRFTEGAEYVITGVVVDKAGNPSDPKTDNFFASTSSHVSCDNEDPETYLTVSQEPGRSLAKVWCRDNRGCQDTYYYTFTLMNSSDNSCSINTATQSQKFTFSANTTHVITQSSRVCWQVTDIKGNTATGSQVIVPLRGNATNRTNTTNNVTAICTDGVKSPGESDVDCGGVVCGSTGKKCDVNKACITALDCKTNNCIGSVCKASSCTDGIQNGNETGKDCGGSCGACTGNNACVEDDDCSSGKKCRKGACLFDEQLPPSEEEPTAMAEDESSSNWLNTGLILIGVLLVIGGSAYIVVYEDPKHFSSSLIDPPIAKFEQEPLVMTPAGKKQNAPLNIGQKKRRASKDRVQNALKDFDSPEELTALPTISHKEIEQAYDKFDEKTFKETTKQLLDENKVEKHDVAIALADAANKEDADTDAIDDLRKHFGIEDEEEKKDR
jgi:hypothetical protein